jgi:hypothetical protein
MHGVLPKFAYEHGQRHEENEISKFLLYYATPTQFEFDEKQQQVKYATRSEMTQRIRHFCFSVFQAMILFSILLPCHFELFPSRPRHSIGDFFYWGNIANNYVMAYLFGIATEGGFTGLAIGTSLASGISTSTLHDHPLVRSTSPSDFWGRRWNKVVGSGLRRGMFRPLRKYGIPATMAAVLTFMVSGILHEYILYLMSLRQGTPNIPNKEPFIPIYGSNLGFFLWNGAVLMCEHLLHGWTILENMKKNLPRPIRTALVLLTVLPISHLFTGEYIKSSFYSDTVMAFPLIVQVHDM